MLRLRIKLNSSRSGVLYHFADDLSTVESILQNGLRISDEYQAHMRDVSPGAKKKLSRMYAENPEMAYVSLARNPSIITKARDMSWNYGVVFSADKLADIAKMMPYNFNTSNRFISYSAQQWDDDKGGFWLQSNLSDWDASITSKGNEPEGETPYDKLVDAMQELKNTPNCPIKVSQDGNEWTFEGNLSKEYSFRDLPKYLQKLLGKADFQSEDRAFFPGKKVHEYVPETKKAIIGVIVPDNQYQMPHCKEFREKHPDVKMYVYHNPVPDYAKSWYETDEPVPKEAYRKPIA